MRQLENRDRAVEAIFELMRQQPADPEANRQAIVRAGLIAQAYCGASHELLEGVFGSATENMLQKDIDDLRDGAHG